MYVFQLYSSYLFYNITMDYLHLQIIKNNFPKASVENSSAEWAVKKKK